MKINHILAVGMLAVSSLSLSACDVPFGKKAPEAAAKSTVKAPEKKKPNADIEDALASIPPEMRSQFQLAIKCDVAGKKNVQITAGYIKDLFQRLKQDPAIAKC